MPPDGLRCKTLVVTCVPAEKRKGKHAKTAAVMVVLLVERRLSIPKLKSENPEGVRGQMARDGLKAEDRHLVMTYYTDYTSNSFPGQVGWTDLEIQNILKLVLKDLKAGYM